jgi:hypothetical protein
MAKHQPLSYENLIVSKASAAPSGASSTMREAADEQPPEPRRQYMRDAAAPYTVYPHPEGAHALKLYALNERRKVHDLWMEAIEEWAVRHGITATFRVQTTEPKRRRS